jgi:predicted permease
MFVSEFRQTLRRLGRSFGFSTCVVLTLALGIGATVSVFSIIHAVLITPLPYPDPSRLCEVFESKLANDEAEMESFAPGNFLDLRARNQTFADLAASFGPHFNLTGGGGEPRHLEGSAISPSMFSILGVKPMLGRAFLPDEDKFSSPHVVILSYRLWSTSFHSDRSITGKSISLNGDPYTVVGVMPLNFRSLDSDPDVWIPLQQQVRPDRMLWRDSHFLTVIGRLRPGVTLDQARADMNRIAGQMKMQYPSSDSGSGTVVMPLQRALVGDNRRSLLLAFGIVVLVLLIAGSNVAILMLARVAGRTRELAVRMALGASGSQILRQVLAESVVLGLISGVLGCALALIGRQLFLRFAPYNPNVDAIHISPSVLAFAALLSIIVGLGFGLLPAIRVLRADVQHILRQAGNASTADTGGRFLRHSLIVGEISLSIVLLVPTGLILRSMQNLQNQPLGFRTDHLIATWIGLPRIRYQNNEDVSTFFTRVDQKLRNAVGADSVALGYRLPIQADRFSASFTVSGKSYQPGEYDHAELYFIDSGYLPLLKIPILDGRNFTDADDLHGQRVAIVSASFARAYWPHNSAVGQTITILRDTPVPALIVGVVGDVRPAIEDEPQPTMYVSYKQISFPSMQVVVSTHDSSSAVLAAVARAVQSVDPEQPVESTSSLESMVHETLDPWRFALSLLAILSGLATILTGLGLFAVISYLVRERTREMGVRMAIGATPMSVLSLVLGQSLRLALLGSLIGFVSTLSVTRVMANTMYALRPNDPAIFFTVEVFVIAVSILAASLPAWRAAHIEPLSALREE